MGSGRFSKLVTDRISIEDSFISPETVCLRAYLLYTICSVFFFSQLEVFAEAGSEKLGSH
jgi:hypothetical protein